MNTELKPCPFCGYPAEYGSLAGNRVRCSNDTEYEFYNYCPASYGWANESEWQKRQDDVEIKKLKEDLSIATNKCWTHTELDAAKWQAHELMKTLDRDKIDD